VFTAVAEAACRTFRYPRLTPVPAF
jgi:hypothetical protein